VLLWRLSASFTLPVLEVLDDGTYICELKPARKRDGPPMRVRVLEYTVWTTTETGEQISELFCLATTLLDPDQAPAAELAALYHDRCQVQTGIGEMKTTVRGGAEVVLRSQDPGLVEQEFWAMLCVYHAIRDLIRHAGPTARTAPRPNQLQPRRRGRPRLGDPGGSLPPRQLTLARAHVCIQLVRKDHLIPARPARQAPHARKRGGSHRYRHRRPGEPAVRTVSHRIELHPLPPRPADKLIT
jgi:hypothetical protein